MSTRDEAKRRRNVRIHGLDFVGAEAIRDGPTVTRKDRGKDYGEKCLFAFGLLDAEVVVLVYVDRDDDMHIISLRRAEKNEARYYFETTKGHFRQGLGSRQPSLVGGDLGSSRCSQGPWTSEGSD